jgi:hypothetical protein
MLGDIAEHLLNIAISSRCVKEVHSPVQVFGSGPIGKGSLFSEEGISMRERPP